MPTDRFADQLRRDAPPLREDRQLAERIVAAIDRDRAPSALPRRPASPVVGFGFGIAVAAAAVCAIIATWHGASAPPPSDARAPIAVLRPIPVPDFAPGDWLARADPLTDEAKRLENDCLRLGRFLADRLPSPPRARGVGPADAREVPMQ